tara:strand:- start:785 stop:1036 length:252 start_codon:yes stop_codon:yes gene_type:complete
MIQAFVIKKILNIVFKKIQEKHNLKKLQKYVEEENELDIKVKQLTKTVNKYGKYIEDLEKDYANFKKKVLKKAGIPVIKKRSK